MKPFLQVSRDAARALSEFSDQFRDALALASFDTWAARFGFVLRTDALKTTFPIPLSAAGYHEFKGDMKYRRLYARSLSMTSKTWQDGVEELAEIIEAPDFIDWAGEPARMAAEWARLPQQLVMDMLESNSGAGPYLDFYRDVDSNTASTKRLFASDHPFNVLDSSVGTFDNDQTTTYAEIANGTFFDSLEEYFRGIMGPNGKPLGLKLDGGNFLIPPRQAALFKRVLESDTIIRAVSSTGVVNATSSVVAAALQNNFYKGTYGYTVADESGDTDVFYAFAAGKPGLYPFVVQQGTAVEEIVHDKTSAKYKDTLKVAVAEIGKANVSAALPHGIVRVHITG